MAPDIAIQFVNAYIFHSGRIEFHIINDNLQLLTVAIVSINNNTISIDCVNLQCFDLG